MNQVAKQKKALRKLFLTKRKNLSFLRRAEASQQLFHALVSKLGFFDFVLSFASFGSEIDLWPLNRLLAFEKKLILPRLLSRGGFELCQVTDLTRDLAKNPALGLFEPVKSSTFLDQSPRVIPQKTFQNALCCVLVPGIAFDSKKQRLGYGKGHYDRFLKALSCPFWGVGFKEQLTKALLPVEPHDIAMTTLYLT